jgi:hypothetical protein
MQTIPSIGNPCPPLSIVLATTDPWPAVKDCLDRLCPQAEVLGVEIIVGDSTGRGLPDPVQDDHRSVRWMKIPGASVFELRARGVEEACGEIIALSEDHCLPSHDWCERILAAHAEQPSAMSVGGAVLNGSTRSLMDWANFFLTFGPFVPPLQVEKIERVAPAANVSFKRHCIPRSPLEPGWIEMVLEAHLQGQKQDGFDERIVVTHVQSHCFFGALATHFHNGRSTAGLIVKEMNSQSRRDRIKRCFILPWEILRTTLQTLRGKPALARIVAACFLPMVLLACCHAAGELTGLLFRGAGNSPKYLQ